MLTILQKIAHALWLKNIGICKFFLENQFPFALETGPSEQTQIMRFVLVPASQTQKGYAVKHEIFAGQGEQNQVGYLTEGSSLMGRVT